MWNSCFFSTNFVIFHTKITNVLPTRGWVGGNFLPDPGHLGGNFLPTQGFGKETTPVPSRMARVGRKFPPNSPWVGRKSPPTHHLVGRKFIPAPHLREGSSLPCHYKLAHFRLSIACARTKNVGFALNSCVLLLFVLWQITNVLKQHKFRMQIMCFCYFSATNHTIC